MLLLTMQVSAARACSPAQPTSAPCLTCNKSNEPLCLRHGFKLSATSLPLPVGRLSAQAMQPSRAFFKPSPPPLLVEEVATPAAAEPAPGVQPHPGSAPPGYQGPAWSLIRPRTGGEAGRQHGSVSFQPAQASPAGPAQDDLSRSVQIGRTGPGGGAQPGRSAAGWADLPGRQEEFMGQALASAQASSGVPEGCRSTRQGLRPGDQAAGSQQGLSPAGRPARQGSRAVPPPAKVSKATEPAGRLVGRTATYNAAWPPQVLLPPSSSSTPQPGAAVSVPTQQASACAGAALATTSAAVSNACQTMPGLSPPLPTSTESPLRHPQTEPLLRHPQTAAFQSAQPNRLVFDHIMQSESTQPHSPLQLQAHLHHQSGPSHGAAALQQQQQTLPMQTHELLSTQPSGSAAAAQLQQHQFSSARTAEQQQTGMWGGQQPASGQDLDVQAPAHGKARPLQPLGVVEELQQVLLEVRLVGADNVAMPRKKALP